MQYRVESGVQPPARGGNAFREAGQNGGRPREYPFDQMQPGDSFHVVTLVPNRVRVALNHWKRNHPQQEFVTRQEDGGIRIWRTA